MLNKLHLNYCKVMFKIRGHGFDFQVRYFLRLSVFSSSIQLKIPKLPIDIYAC